MGSTAQNGEGETGSSETNTSFSTHSIDVYTNLQIQTQAFQLVQQWWNGLGSRLRDRASTHKFDQSDRGCTQTMKVNTGFLTLRNAQGFLCKGQVGRTIQGSVRIQEIG
jgi:hypothetical protein